MDTEPTIEQMIESCTRHTSTENTMTQAVVKGITEGVSGAFAAAVSKENARCFYCGELGHFIKDCPQRSPNPGPLCRLPKAPETATAPAASKKLLSECGVKALRPDNKSKAILPCPSCKLHIGPPRADNWTSPGTIIPGDPRTHEKDPTHRALPIGTRRQLVTSLPINFVDKRFYRIPTGKYGPQNGPWDILILSDTIHGPEQLFVLPEIQTVHPGQEILVQPCCTDTPFFLPQGTLIAQAFLLPQNRPE